MAICGDDDDQDSLLNNCLPNEILTKIFSYLSLKELRCSVRVVCQRWFEISYSDILWSKLTAEDVKEYLTELSPTAVVQLIRRHSSSLRYLLLDHCNNISRPLLHTIADLVPKLCELSLAFCVQVDKPILKTFSDNCRQIRVLNVEGCEDITDDCLTLFQGHAITRLNLSHCNHLTDDSLVFVSNTFRNIKDLNLDGVQWIGDEAVNYLLQNCKNTLQHLWLDGENLTDLALVMLGSCHYLRTLKISYCEQLTDLTLFNIPHLENLESLSLRKGKNFSDKAILSMFQNLQTGLFYVDFTDCQSFSDSALLCLTQSSPNLVTLDLSWCWKISDEGLAHIVYGCRRMENLTLIGLHILTGEPLRDTLEKLPQLKYLDLRNCNSIQDNIIEDVAKRNNSLSILDYYGSLLE